MTVGLTVPGISDQEGEREPGFTTAPAHPSIIVVGLGNPILGDDGVGWHVAEKVRQRLEEAGPLVQRLIEVDCAALGGLSMMERLVDYQQAIIIDAMTTRRVPLGAVFCLSLEDLPDYAAGHLTAAHDTSLQNAMAIGRAMGVELPREVIIVGIEAENVYDFSEELTSTIENAVPEAVETVYRLLSSWTQSG